MPANLVTAPLVDPSTGGLYADNGNFQTDGKSGSPTFGGARSEAGLTGTVQTLTNGNTINISRADGSPAGAVHVTTGGAVTGIILPVGTRPYQELTVIHEGSAANTITFAAASANNPGGPADGTSDVITGPSGRTFRWNSVTGLWYKIG